MKNVLSRKAKRVISWLKQQPAIHALEKRFPRGVRFVVERFDPKVFVGLPLTLIVLAFVMNVALLSELTENVLESESIVTFDMEFTALLFDMRSESLSRFLFLITHLAGRASVFILGGLASVIFLYRKKWVALLAFWLTMLGVGLSIRFGKLFFSRVRPEDVAYYVVEHFSFPSGHATTAMALYGMLAYFLYRHFDNGPTRKLILVLATLLIVLIGFSRIYLGVHYFSDVLAGSILGALWVLVGISMVELLIYSKNSRTLRMDARDL